MDGPEVLSESLDIDYILADVYSFGIIMWELLTREQPYAGMRFVLLSELHLSDKANAIVDAAPQRLQLQ